MKSSIFYISLLFSLLLLGCSKKEKVKEPQIHLVSSALIDDFVMDEQKTRYEYYIVSNYDSNEEKALNLIRMFNEDLIRNKESIINNYDLYYRAFYKESKKMPYDFANDYGFSPDYIDDHSEDFICYISMDKRVIFKDTIVKWNNSCENIKQCEKFSSYYDHFGLDYPDLIKYPEYDIFYAWFTLQHFRGYRPLMTTIEFEEYLTVII